MTNAPKIIIAAIIIFTAATVGAIVADSINQTNDESERRSDVKVTLSGDDWVEVSDDEFGKGTNETVIDSRGFGLFFNGASDSRVDFDSDVEFYSDKNWTVSQGVLGVHENATEKNMTVLALGDPVNLYIRYSNVSGTANFSAVVMDPGDSYMVNVTVADPTDTRVLFVTRNHTNVTIWTNTTAGESADTSVENDVSIDLTNDSNFHGTLDETRTFDDLLTDSERSTIATDAVRPMPGTNRTARMMFDAGSGMEISVYWADTDATGVNVSYVDGFAGNELDRAGIISGNDYRWRASGPQIRPSDGGRIEGAPVVWVDYDFIDQLSDFLHGYTAFTQMIELVMIVLMATVLVLAVMRIQMMD